MWKYRRFSIEQSIEREMEGLLERMKEALQRELDVDEWVERMNEKGSGFDEAYTDFINEVAEIIERVVGKPVEVFDIGDFEGYGSMYWTWGQIVSFCFSDERFSGKEVVVDVGIRGETYLGLKVSYILDVKALPFRIYSMHYDERKGQEVVDFCVGKCEDLEESVEEV